LAREGVHVSASAVALLQEARRCGLRLAVASSSRHCSEILRAGCLTAFFDAQVDGIDLDRLGLSGKPAADMFLEAARRLGVPPRRTVVFEDATAGIAAAAPAVSAWSLESGPVSRQQHSSRAAPIRPWPILAKYVFSIAVGFL
jgi:HAD superfamily hydrolase (TIGR01509 family)